MSNELRLLRAFIEAQGYEIEETLKEGFTNRNSQNYGQYNYKLTKPKKTRKFKEVTYPQWFERLVADYPDRAGSNPKKRGS